MAEDAKFTMASINGDLKDVMLEVSFKRSCFLNEIERTEQYYNNSNIINISIK